MSNRVANLQRYLKMNFSLLFGHSNSNEYIDVEELNSIHKLVSARTTDYFRDTTVRFRSELIYFSIFCLLAINFGHNEIEAVGVRLVQGPGSAMILFFGMVILFLAFIISAVLDKQIYDFMHGSFKPYYSDLVDKYNLSKGLFFVQLMNFGNLVRLVGRKKIQQQNLLREAKTRMIKRGLDKLSPEESSSLQSIAGWIWDDLGASANVGEIFSAFDEIRGKFPLDIEDELKKLKNIDRVAKEIHSQNQFIQQVSADIDRELAKFKTELNSRVENLDFDSEDSLMHACSRLEGEMQGIGPKLSELWQPAIEGLNDQLFNKCINGSYRIFFGGDTFVTASNVLDYHFKLRRRLDFLEWGMPVIIAIPAIFLSAKLLFDQLI